MRNVTKRYTIAIETKKALDPTTWTKSFPFINDALEKNGEKPFSSVTVMSTKINQVIRDNPDIRFDTFTQELETKNFPDDWRHGWIKSKGASIFIKKGAVNYHIFREELLKDIKDHAPDYRPLQRKVCDDPHLLVVEASDIHLWKLAVESETGESYNMEIAYNKIIAGIEWILHKSRGYSIDKILLPIGNDILHTDSPFRKTTAWTPQDTDGQWHEAFIKARKLYVQVIEMLLPIADVHCVYNPSNHDYQSWFMLADSVASWYSKSKNIVFDTSIRHRKYFDYGKNLIATSHGDGAKEKDVGMLMAHEAPDLWARCPHRYIYLHHIHHKKSFEGIWYQVEYMRSPSGTDGWHDRNGYVGSKQAIEAFLHHAEDGRVCSIIQKV